MRSTMSASAPESRDPTAYRPLMGVAPRAEVRALCAASPDGELPSLRGFLWAVAWVLGTVLLVAQIALGA
jgi:hypothetical protein